jgi:hypothetical protein
LSAAPLIAALRSRDEEALGRLLARDVTFHSPLADYDDPEQVKRLFLTIGQVVDDMRPQREVVDGRESVAFLTAEVDGRRLDGVLDVIHDNSGRARQVTLMLRPLDSLLVAVKRMGIALEGA